jgi:hypothetical protein
VKVVPSSLKYRVKGITCAGAKPVYLKQKEVLIVATSTVVVPPAVSTVSYGYEVISAVSSLHKTAGDHAEHNRATLNRDGRKFTSAVVDVADGYIREVYTHERAEEHGYHHSSYLYDNDQDAVNSGDAVIIWVSDDGTKVLVDVRYHKSLAKDKQSLHTLLDRFLEQVEISQIQK